MEQVCPLLIVGLHTLSQWRHTVHAVPLGQVFQPVVDGVIQFDVVRIDEATDVLVPTTDALLQGTHRHGVAGLLGQILERETQPSPLAVFCYTTHHVLPQFVVLTQENVNLHRQQGLWCDVLQALLVALPTLIFLLISLTIGVLERQTHHQRVLTEGVAVDGHPQGYALWDARLLTAVSQSDGQQVGVLRIVAEVLFLDGRHLVVGLHEVKLINLM